MSKYKLIQLTNNSIAATAADTLLPFGTITRRINDANTCNTFQIASSLADTLYINEPGYYKVTYSATMSAAAAGTLGISLIVNQAPVYTVAEEVTAAEDVVNLTLVYVVRVCPNACSAPYNCPASIQMKLNDVATGVTPNPSTTNLLVERVYC
jgi:hypothetical protein